jgi:hypothetical protein
MAAELPRPGVEVIQQFEATSPSVIVPVLVPFVTGPAKEIVELTTSEGAVNTDAKQGTYEQLPQVVAQSAFPSPRGNIAEVNVEEDSIRAAMLFGGRLSQLDRDPGSAFHVAWNNARRAAFRTPEITGAGLALDGLTLVLAIDQTVRLNTTEDVVITFATVGGGSLTAQQIADQINDAVGQEVATLIPVSSNNRVQIASPTWGAGSSVTIRAGASANTLLVALTDAVEYRVEAAGFYGQDQADNTTLSAFIAWSRGNRLDDGVITSFVTAPGNDGSLGQISLDSSGAEVFAEAQAPAVTFTGGGSLDLKVGDYFFTDGVRPNSTAEISRVESARFKLGTINTQLSTFDDDGDVLTAVYDDSKVNTLLAGVPFSPRYAWFRARKLLGENTAATAAVATGSKQGTPATVATILGAGAGGGPFALAGLTLVVGVTDDGVEQDDFTFTFTGGPFADMPAVATAIAGNIPGVVAANEAGQLRLSTTSTGADQALVLRATSTAGAILGFTSLPTSDAGTDVEFRDIAAVLTGGAQTFPFTAVNGETLVIDVSSDGGATWPVSRTFTAQTGSLGPHANIAALLGMLNTAARWDGGTLPTQFAISNNGNALIITSTATGATAALRVNAASTGIGVTTNADYQLTSGQTDVGEENLQGLTFKFRLNDRPDIYTVVFTADSLDEAVAEINEVVGFPVASIGGGSDSQLVLTSPLEGAASKIEIIDDGTNTRAFAAFGYTSGQTVSGSGRPNPDFRVDSSGNAVIGAEILRNAVTGQPFGNSRADLYIQYTGLRLDVSPRAEDRALLSISDTTTLGQVLSPLNLSNPLGLAMFFQIINAPGIACKGMGVGETSAGEPDGTLRAYTEVADFIQSEEIYAICPLTTEQTVFDMFREHVEFMSGPTQKGERILVQSPLDPERAVDVIVASGLSADTTATPNQLIIDVNPNQGLVDNGINPALPIPQSDEVFVELVVVTGATQEIRRYSVASVNGVLVTFRTTFTGGFNAEGFYSTTTLNETLVNADWSMKIRGAELLIPGSPLPDKDKIAETVAARNNAIKNRRVVSVFPDTVVATIEGTDQLIPSYYAGSAITGMIASNAPQQGFTNLPMTGFTGVKGSNDKFSTRQLNIMAGGGTYILVQEIQGGPVTSRHQLTTDLTSIETRELSITKVVDFVAKFMRTGLRNFIGTFNITQPFLDMLSTVIQGMLSFLEEGGVILGGDLNNLIQDKNAPDTVTVDITLDVPFPCNYIRLTLTI